jgi:hypothetical protein
LNKGKNNLAGNGHGTDIYGNMHRNNDSTIHTGAGVIKGVVSSTTLNADYLIKKSLYNTPSAQTCLAIPERAYDLKSGLTAGCGWTSVGTRATLGFYGKNSPVSAEHHIETHRQVLGDIIEMYNSTSGLSNGEAMKIRAIGNASISTGTPDANNQASHSVNAVKMDNKSSLLGLQTINLTLTIDSTTYRPQVSTLLQKKHDVPLGSIDYTGNEEGDYITSFGSNVSIPTVSTVEGIQSAITRTGQ